MVGSACKEFGRDVEHNEIRLLDFPPRKMSVRDKCVLTTSASNLFHCYNKRQIRIGFQLVDMSIDNKYTLNINSMGHI